MATKPTLIDKETVIDRALLQPLLNTVYDGLCAGTTPKAIRACLGLEGDRVVVVDTVADLRAHENATNPGLVFLTLGALEAGDGGGGAWRWDAYSTESDNLGTVVLPTGRTGAGRRERLRDSLSLHSSWFGARHDLVIDNNGDYVSGTDDTAALNAAFDLFRTLANGPGGQYYGGYSLYIDGPSLCDGSINATDILATGARIVFTGSALIHSRASGKIAFDMTGSRWVTTSGLRVHGDAVSVPAVGVVQSRLSTGAGASQNNHYELIIQGSFTVAGFASLAAEESAIYHANIQNRYNSPDAVCLLCSSVNDVGITSDFQTIATASGSNNNLSLVGVSRFYKNGQGRPIRIVSAHGFSMQSGYAWMDNQGGTVDSQIIVEQDSGNRSNERFDINIHTESNTDPNYVIKFSGGTGVNRAIRIGMDWDANVSNAVLAFDNSRGIDGLDLMGPFYGTAPWEVISGTVRLVAAIVRDVTATSNAPTQFDLAGLVTFSGLICCSESSRITMPTTEGLATGGIAAFVSNLAGGPMILASAKSVSIADTVTDLPEPTGRFMRINVLGTKIATINNILGGLDGREVFLCTDDTVTFSGTGNVKTTGSLPANGVGYMHLVYRGMDDAWIEL
jgi:hypothetical protein